MEQALMIRQALRVRGFDFIDDDYGSSTTSEVVPKSIPDSSRKHTALLHHAVDASSTDDITQSVSWTLSADNRFWSSTGTAQHVGGAANAFLIYKLRGPLSAVRTVILTVYRALYQFGHPIYPCQRVSFQCGPTFFSVMDNDAPPESKTHEYEVSITHAPQVFHLPPDFPIGRYLRVNLIGRRQQQLEDMLYYIAVERVEAYGEIVTAKDFARLRSLQNAPGIVDSYRLAGHRLYEL